ncbi:uncharacterized protein RSE6_11814 [Rhynchosporium secalis]|uniref:Uncharacterized protein n=1 Tax=Rhynchosporium secalis TaxID=38038 RepID=A0A1E1MNU3_RHYSE|nr:uncharacterized protein RSE6_11814 [Rhynchosporium secalis]
MYQQSGMGFAKNPNAWTADPVVQPSGGHMPPGPNLEHEASVENKGDRFRYQQQVRALKEQLRVLKALILKSGGSSTNPLGIINPSSSSKLEQTVLDRGALSEVTFQRDGYFDRVQNLERRVGELLSSESSGGVHEPQDMLTQRDIATDERDRLSYETLRESGYLSPIQALRRQLEHSAAETEHVPRLYVSNAAAEDRDKLLNENEFLKERLTAMFLEYEAVVEQRNRLKIQRDSIEAQLCVLPAQEIDAGRNRTVVEDYEAKLQLVRVERDSAIQQNEEARRNLATRTAERNGAHQRMHILEAATKESHTIKEHLEAQLRLPSKNEHVQANTQTIETECDSERIQIAFLQSELEHAVAAAAEAQHQRDAARAEIEAVEIENSIAISAAEMANDVVVELQSLLEATKHAALAEREKSEESRRIQNRLRIERETVRIEVAKLGRELSAAHQTSAGLVTQLDELRTRNTSSTQDDAALGELNPVIGQRDQALIHVKKLEQLLRDLEDDYRKNLDQWERQTQKDEVEIHAAKSRLDESMETNESLSKQLDTANAGLEAAETRARMAEESSENANSRSEALQIQIQQVEQDLDHSNEDKDEVEGVRDHLRAECLRLGGLITNARNEVIRMGGDTIAPEGTVQSNQELPNGPARGDFDPSNIQRPLTARGEPISEPDDEHEFYAFPYPAEVSSMAEPEVARNQSISSGSSLSSIDSSVDSVHGASSRRESNVSTPAQRPQHGSSSSASLLRTSPTISTQIDPRCTRNPAPDYGASSRSKSRKRGAEPTGFEGQSEAKRRRLHE